MTNINSRYKYIVCNENGQGAVLHPNFQHGPLNELQQQEIQKEVLDYLYTVQPLLKHIMEVKVVSNPRRNFVNLRIKSDYLPMIYYELTSSGAYFCFFLSDKLEPFVIITCVDPEHGRLFQLTQPLLSDLEVAIINFKNKFGIQNETYHYTPKTERVDSHQESQSGKIAWRNKSHSTHWHLKMRIATQMYRDKLQILKLFDLDKVKNVVEPVFYNFNRTTMPWKEVFQMMEKELENK
jgi:hypothetical protein